MKQSVLSKLRRLMALCLALLLIVSLTGCFQKEDPDTPDGTEDQSQTDPTNGTVPTDAPTEEPTEAPTEAPVQTVTGTVSANNLNVRSNPSTDSTVLSQLPVDLSIEILEQRIVGDTTWGRIGQMTLPNGKTITGGWINLHYVKLDNAGSDDNQTTTGGTTTGGSTTTGTGKMGTITASELNIRESTSTSSNSVGSYIKGDRVEILEQKSVDGTTWGRTVKGWISMKYVTLDGSTTTNTGNDDDDDTTTSSEVVSDGKTTVLGYCVIDLGSLNVRSGPGTKYDKVDTVSEGERYAYYQKSGNWVRIKDGWVSTSYVYIEGTTGSDGGTGTVTADELNLRAGPGSGYKSNGSVKEGDTVTILAQVNGWGYTTKGWVSMKYITLAAPTYPTGTGTVTTDLNIRKEASADSDKVGTYEEGASVTITEVSNGWGKTDKGWISMKYVNMGTGGNTTYKVGTATVNVNSNLHIRKEAKADSDSLGYLENGETVKVLEVSNTCWGKIEYKTGEYGWINLKYVKY